VPKIGRCRQPSWQGRFRLVGTSAGKAKADLRTSSSCYGAAVPKAASSTVNDQSRFADSTTMWKTRGSSAA
jgi:hypothetical protein